MIATPNYGLSTDTTLGGNSPSDIISPSEKAIKTYIDNHAGGLLENIMSQVVAGNNPVDISALQLAEQQINNLITGE